MSRYPQTVRTLTLFVVFGVVIGLGALWKPSLWILIGILAVVMLVVSLREDRKP